MSRAHATAAPQAESAPRDTARGATRSPAEHAGYPDHSGHTEHEADRFAAHATTGRAADWSFGQVPVHSEVGPTPRAARLAAKLTGSGRPLDTATARTLGAGHDLSDVRVHTGPDAAALARDAGAEAVTVGRDIAFADGRYDPGTQRGRHLLAHELAHTVQHRDNPLAMHRKEVGERTAAPAQGDYEMFVDEAVNYLTTATGHYRTMAQAANVPSGVPNSQQGQQQAPANGAGLSADRLPEALKKLQETYDSSREIVEQHLNGDAKRTEKLRRSYVDAAAAARAAAVGMPRANLIIVAAPKAANDWFVTNATSYAKMYYGKPRDGSVVSMIENVDSVDALFDAVEQADPNRMIGRVDIFCHGTIDPVHQLRLGAVWHRIGDFTQVAQARAGKAATLATQSRFDGSTVIELHACRLGAGLSDPGQGAEAATTGTDFLTGFGESLGGDQGQTVTGYRQRWAPRVFRVGGLTSVKGLKGARLKAFEKIAVRNYDAVMAGSAEVRNLLTDAETKSGTVTEARKIAIMTDLYNTGKGWIIGHQYSGADPLSTDPATDVKGKRDTFSSEKDWQSLTLTVQVPKAAGGTP